MTAPKAIKEKPANAARACLDDIPYRMLVYKETNGHGKPLFLVAGSSAAAAGAEKALKAAHRLHGGNCFYCKERVAAGDATIDHVEAEGVGGRDHIQNLLIACKPCNVAKGHKPIELYSPEAGREWLSALLCQVQDRLNRLA